MSLDCPTVKVKSDHPDHDGYFTINESDFDATKHEKFIAPPPPFVPPLPPAPVAPTDPLAGLSANWKEGSATDLKALAAAVSGRTVDNADQAKAVIAAELAKRAAASPPPVA